MEYFFHYLKISKEIEDKSGIADAYINIGSVYTQQKKDNDASLYLNKGLSLPKKLVVLNLLKTLMRAGEVRQCQGNFKQALRTLQTFIVYRDSLFNEENTKKSSAGTNAI